MSDRIAREFNRSEATQAEVQGIFWGLSVRISVPWGKSTPRKNFKILFWIETSKNDLWGEGLSLKVPL